MKFKGNRNLKEIERAVEKKLKKCKEFSLEKAVLNFHTTAKRREIESRTVE